jgi:hypothetical protein
MKNFQLKNEIISVKDSLIHYKAEGLNFFFLKIVETLVLCFK